jgi:uncharacterized protein (TIGR02757 family)
LPADAQGLRDCLERIYQRYNRRELIHPDPLEFLWHYEDQNDREIAGLVASGLAYGRVAQILKSVGRVLDALGRRPSLFLREASEDQLRGILAGFKHRFTTLDEMTRFLRAVSDIQSEYGSLGTLLGELRMEEGYGSALDSFVTVILGTAGMERCSLLPRPRLGSACKRFSLFLRWMVRRDDVDPGGWDHISPSLLMVPVDVHMYRISRALGFTSRKAADGKTAMEITRGFRRINPDDPVKYDFALTRMGIQGREADSLFTELREGYCCFIDTEP